MTHTFRYITVLLATVTTCFAGRGQEGKSSFDFLNIPTSTHAYTLGGTNISVIDEDINLVNQNPALMGPESDLQLGLNYMKYVGGINLAGATFGKAAGERGAWAAGVQYYGYGKMKSADETGVITGEFHPKTSSSTVSTPTTSPRPCGVESMPKSSTPPTNNTPLGRLPSISASTTTTPTTTSRSRW